MKAAFRLEKSCSAIHINLFGGSGGFRLHRTPYAIDACGMMLDVANYKSDAGDAGLPPGTWVLLTQNMGAPDA